MIVLISYHPSFDLLQSQQAYQSLSRLEDVLQHVLETALLNESLVHAVEEKSRTSVFNGVVLGRLNVLFEQEPREKSKRKLAMPRRVVVDIDRVDDLRRWDKNVCSGV